MPPLTAPSASYDRRLLFLLSAGLRRVQRWMAQRTYADGGLTATRSGLLFFLGKSDGVLIGEAAGRSMSRPRP